MRWKNLNATSFQRPEFRSNPSHEAKSFHPSPPKIVNLSDSDSLEDLATQPSGPSEDVLNRVSASSGLFSNLADAPQFYVLTRAFGSGSSRFFGDPQCVLPIDTSSRACASLKFYPNPPNASPIDVLNHASSSAGIFRDAQRSPPLEVPTFSGLFPNSQRAQFDGSTRASGSTRFIPPEDVPSNRVVESQIQNGMWFVGRMSPRGAGPKCCGSLGRMQ